MKNKILIILLCFIPFVINAATCEPDKIVIESVEQKDMTGYVLEKAEPTVNGRNLGVDVKMYNVGDSIEYKMIVKNESNEDYELDETSTVKSSDYIEYSLNTLGNNIIKAGESREVILTVKYKTEVPETSFVNGTFTDNKSIVVNLSSDNEESVVVTNPKTGTNIYLLIIIVVLVTGAIVYLILSKSKYNQMMVIIICMMIIIPCSVKALCKCEIVVDSKVEITTNKVACIYTGVMECGVSPHVRLDKKYVEYTTGMKVSELIEREKPKLIQEYNPSISNFNYFIFSKPEIEACENAAISEYDNGDITHEQYSSRINSCKEEHSNMNTINTSDEAYQEYMNSEVKPSTEGCYDMVFGTIC